MLHCNMKNASYLQLALEDLLANLRFARKHGQLGRLAYLTYCEAKAWARLANKPDLADKAIGVFSQNPCVSKVEFLQNVDSVIAMLELYELAHRKGNVRCAVRETACGF
jgi:hypothetical protein